MLNQIQLKRQLLKSRDELEGFTQKNKSVFYQPDETKSINLSAEEGLISITPSSESHATQIFRWSAKEFDQHLNKQRINLNSLLKISKDNFNESNNLFKKLRYFSYLSELSEYNCNLPSLYLLGPFLSWKSQLNVTNAPIFKIPVFLTRDSDNNFYLILKDENFSLNNVLLHFLDYFFNLRINEERVFTSVNYALHYLIEKLRLNNIDIQYLKYKYEIKFEEDSLASSFSIYDFVYLDFLENDNLPLYKDYCKILDNLHENQFISRFLKQDIPVSNTSNLVEENIFPFIFYHNDQYIYDVLTNIENHNFVALRFVYGFENYKEISNILVQYILAGKNTIFVSENVSVLKYLYKEISGKGLKNRIALPLQEFSNKLELFENLFEQEEDCISDLNNEKFEHNLNNLRKYKFEINELIKLLQEKHLKSGLANFEILYKVFFANQELFDNNVYQKFGYIEWEKLASILEDINGIQYFYNRLDNNLDSPWRFKLAKTLKNKKIFDELQEIKENIHNIKGKRSYLEYKFQQFNSQHGISEQISKYFHFLEKCNEGIEISYDYRILWENKTDFIVDLPIIKERILSLLSEIEKFSHAIDSASEGTTLEVIEELLAFFSSVTSSSYLKWIQQDYWKYKKIAKQLIPKWDGSISIFFEIKHFLNSYNELKKCISQIKYHTFQDFSISETLSGEIHKVVQELNNIILFFQEAKECFSEKHFSELTESYYSFKNFMRVIKEAADIGQQLADCDTHFLQEWNKLSQFIQIDKIKLPTVEKKLTFINILIDRMDDIDFIHQYNKIITNLQEKYDLINLDIEIIETLSTYKIPWKDVVYSSVIVGWLNDILMFNPLLKSYGREFLENLSLEYFEANEFVKANLFNYHNERIHSDTQTLREQKIYKQLQDKILADRSVMLNPEEKKFFQALKSCWLMTPNMVSKILPMENSLFDLLVIDVKENFNFDKYIPSIYRSKKIMRLQYDSRIECSQLNKKVQSVENQGIHKKDFYNSLFLEQVSTKFQNILTTQHEPLLTFINYAFYAGELLLACKPLEILSTENIEYYEVQFHQGKTREEQFLECNDVAFWLSSNFLNSGLNNFVIVTTTIEQLFFYRENLYCKIKLLIENEISIEELKEKIKIFHFSDIHKMQFDVVIFAVANILSQGKIDYQAMLLPLKENNIKEILSNLISSIQIKFVLFNPFPLYLIETNDSSYMENYNLCILGRFLKYCKALATRQYDKALQLLKTFPKANGIEQVKISEFALFVKAKLVNSGFKVTEMFGYNNIIIDLVVFHPNSENEILLGIECDECLTHSSQALSDKLNIRDKILIQSGWNLEKIYSIDWLRNPELELKRLLQIIHNLVECFEIHKSSHAFTFLADSNLEKSVFDKPNYSEHP